MLWPLPGLISSVILQKPPAILDCEAVYGLHHFADGLLGSHGARQNRVPETLHLDSSRMKHDHRHTFIGKFHSEQAHGAVQGRFGDPVPVMISRSWGYGNHAGGRAYGHDQLALAGDQMIIEFLGNHQWT